MAATALQMILHEALVLSGTAGSIAATTMGYILKDSAVELNITRPGGGPIFVHHEQLPIRHIRPDCLVDVNAELTQYDVDIVGIILGLTPVGNIITLGDATESKLAPQVSTAIVGTDFNGDTVRFDAKYGSFSGEMPNSWMSRGTDPNAYAVNFRSEAVSGAYPFLTLGDTALTITGGGDLAITSVVHKVKGAGDAADALTTIDVGATLPLGHIVRLTPFTTDYLITVTHGAPTIVLFGATNFTMGGDASDYIDLKKTAAAIWTEIGRRELP